MGLCRSGLNQGDGVSPSRPRGVAGLKRAEVLCPQRGARATGRGGPLISRASELGGATEEGRGATSRRGALR